MALPEARFPVIALSLRYDRIDVLWFRLGHELGHIINGDGLEPNIDIDLVGKRRKTSAEGPKIEQKADKFAEELLVPPDELESFIGRPACDLTGSVPWQQYLWRIPIFSNPRVASNGAVDVLALCCSLDCTDANVAIGRAYGDARKRPVASRGFGVAMGEVTQILADIRQDDPHAQGHDPKLPRLHDEAHRAFDLPRTVPVQRRARGAT